MLTNHDKMQIKKNYLFLYISLTNVSKKIKMKMVLDFNFVTKINLI